MKEYIISADIISFIFMAVTLCGVFMSSLKNRKTSTKMFIILLFTDLIAIIIDIFSFVMEGIIQNDAYLAILNLFAYAFAVVLIDIFSFYMISVIRERITISYKILIKRSYPFRLPDRITKPPRLYGIVARGGEEYQKSRCLF